ncbi:hypothetical protein FO519_002706 [Halicephalobus sp. NKZ332]|nr:hypothetical protein FO519_002706 [Halicephalobus sp. NKZ332]
MPLTVARESVFCLDFTRETQKEYSPYDATIPEIVYRKCNSQRIAFAFDQEKLGLTFGSVKDNMESFAAGLLASGLKPNDRILICGYNHSQLILSTLGSARAGLVFGLANPNFQTPDQLRHLLSAGEFRAVILFSPNKNVDLMYELMVAVCPEMKSCPRGKLKSSVLPKLTHVILGDEDHKHSGSFTLSEIFAKSTKEKIEKLPNYSQWNPHRLAGIGFSLGSSGPPKAVGLTHYQLINGCRIASNAIGIKSETVLCCALPLFRMAVFCLVVFTPFLTESRSVFSEPSPIPRGLFQSIKKYQCTCVLSNAAALRLGLRTFFTHKLVLPSVDTVILLGERVTTELLVSVDRVMSNSRKIAVGMLLAEVGCVPVISDNTTNLIKAIGRPLECFEIMIEKIPKLSTEKKIVGELKFKPLKKTKFIGFGPDFNSFSEFISTGDIAAQGADGNIEIITHKDDIIYDKNDNLIEHWKMERIMATYAEIRGVQLYIPDKFSVIDDFPRVNTKIQKYKLRQLLRAGFLQLY